MGQSNQCQFYLFRDTCTRLTATKQGVENNSEKCPRIGTAQFSEWSRICMWVRKVRQKCRDQTRPNSSSSAPFVQRLWWTFFCTEKMIVHIGSLSGKIGSFSQCVAIYSLKSSPSLTKSALLSFNLAKLVLKNQVHAFSEHFNAPLNDLWRSFKSLRTLWNDEHVSQTPFSSQPNFDRQALKNRPWWSFLPEILHKHINHLRLFQVPDGAEKDRAAIPALPPPSKRRS
jgi:hypothetical protein